MGLVSNALGEGFLNEDSDDKSNEGDKQMYESVVNHTKRVSQSFFPAPQHKVHENRLYQHLLLTQ
jgi:hypothetical protein